MPAPAKRSRTHNLRTLFGLSQVLCDTQTHAILDPIHPSELLGAIHAIRNWLQRSNSLNSYPNAWHVFYMNLLLTPEVIVKPRLVQLGCRVIEIRYTYSLW